MGTCRMAHGFYSRLAFRALSVERGKMNLITNAFHAVEDEGGTISVAHRAKQQGKGAGLGPAVAYGIMKEHGGHIDSQMDRDGLN